ncbi:MAG: heterodisulfide reductase-related iron-sulfur binding cluster [Candidatus Jordarchaeales archaeon]
MVELKHVKALSSMAQSCSGIGDCRTAYRQALGWYGVCPMVDHTPGFEPYYARGKMRAIRGLLEGKFEPSGSFARVMYQCTLCGACKAVCHVSGVSCITWPTSKFIDHTRLFEALRADLVELGLGPMPRHKEILNWISREHNPYMEKHGDRLAWAGGYSLKAKGDMFFFVGCTGPYRMPEVCRDVYEVAAAAGVNLVMSPEEWCCGSIALRVGDRKLAESLARHNLEVFEKAGARTVVTHCAGCYRTLKKDYPEILGSMPFEVIHVTELLARLIEEGRLELAESSLTVTYHDPCHLGRHCNVYDEPRKIVKSIPGVKLVEMKRNRDGALCCGAGGGVRSAFPELALSIARERLSQAEETGAQVLLSACPFCERNLSDARSYKPSTKLQVEDVVSFVKRHLKRK